MEVNILQHYEPARIAGSKLLDGRTIVALDMGKEPLPLHGKEYRYGLFEETDNGALKHIDGGIMTNDRRAILGHFNMKCAEATGLKVQ